MQAHILRYMSFIDGALVTDQDETNATLNYYGFTRPGGSYVIMKADGSDPVEFTYFLGNDGDSGYTTSWTNRASLSYSRAINFKRL